MKSCLYWGRVRHRRHAPIEHRFTYPLFMVYLDLEEVPGLFAGRWLWSADPQRRLPAAARFRRRDHLDGAARDLGPRVRDLVEAETGRRPQGPVRLLTHLRYFGHCFNPVSFFFCFDQAEELHSIVAEVDNTPWNERHHYVLWDGLAAGAQLRSSRFYQLEKAFHVSPFMDMDHDYRWRFTVPGSDLLVHMENYQSGQRLFDATLRLRRREIDSFNLGLSLLRFPLMTGRVLWAIYWQALRLRLKSAPFFAHPEKRRPINS